MAASPIWVGSLVAGSLALGLFSAACSAVLGIEGFSGDTDGSAGADTDGRAEVGSSADGMVMDAPMGTRSPPDGGTGPTEDGGCSDLSDPDNCGACGHSCLGGSCEGGLCLPTLLAQINAPTAFGTPAIALDTTNVYWANGYGLLSCSQAGCGSTPNYVTPVGGADGGNPNIASIAVDQDNVYWSINGNGLSLPVPALGGCPKTGCTGSPITYGVTAAGASIVVDATNIYWTASPSPSTFATLSDVFTCPKAGCSQPTMFVSGAQAGMLAIDSTHLYWSGANTSECTTASCSSSQMQLFVPAGPPAINSATLFVVAPVGSSNAGRIISCAIPGGCAGVPGLVEDTVDPTCGGFPCPGLSIVADDQNVYYLGGGGPQKPSSVLKCSVTGCTKPTVVFDDPSQFLAGIALSTDWVFFTSNGGAQVYKVPK